MKITKKVITEKEECLDVIVKKELDLRLIDRTKESMLEAIKGVTSELVTLDQYETLAPEVQTILSDYKMGFGLGELIGVYAYDVKVGELYHEWEEKVWHGPSGHYQDKDKWVCGMGGRMRVTEKEWVLTDGGHSETVKHSDLVEETGMYLYDEKTKAKAEELKDWMQSLKEEIKTREKYGPVHYRTIHEEKLTYSIAIKKKEEVTDLGKEIISFFEDCISSLDEVKDRVEKGLYESGAVITAKKWEEK